MTHRKLLVILRRMARHDIIAPGCLFRLLEERRYEMDDDCHIIIRERLSGGRVLFTIDHCGRVWKGYFRGSYFQ